MFKDSVRTAQEIHCVSVITTSQLVLRGEITPVCSETVTKYVNALLVEDREILEIQT